MDRNTAAVVGIALFALVILGIVASSAPYAQSDREPPPSENGTPVEEPLPESQDVEGFPSAQLLFVALLALVGAVGAVVGYRALTRTTLGGDGAAVPPPETPEVDDEDTDDADEGEEDDESLDEVGAAAGRAADRLRGEGSFENEVYRAWWEMTRALSVSRPRHRTAREFAAAAVRAGMDPEDVRDLTRLFEDVRYGGREPDDDAEERAVAVLERIEVSYRGESDTPENDASGGDASEDAGGDT